MDVSVIIVNYNTKDLIRNCIQSIYDKTVGIEYEIIVVDNNSQDGSQEMIKNEFPKVILLELSENIGFGRANNEGAKCVNGKNILLLNPDTVLINNAIEILHRYIISDLNIGACGGNLYDEMMQPTHSFRRLLPGIASELNDLTFRFFEKIFYNGCREHNFTQSPIEVAYITGADLMINRELFFQVKGFNPIYFMYYEETQLCLDLKRLGRKVVSVPDAKIQHLEGKSFKSNMINESRIRFSEISRHVYLNYNFGAYLVYIANLIYCVDVLLRILFSVVTFRSTYKFWTITLKEFLRKY